MVRPPARAAAQAPARLPDIQFDIGDFIAPVETIDGVKFRFGPVFTKFVTASLTRTPTRDDQAVLADALATIEQTYPFAPDGVFTFVAYGVPYFRRLSRRVVLDQVPRLVDALPNGPTGYATAQVFMAGGVPEVMLHLRRLGLLNRRGLTATGETLDATLDWWESSDRRRAD